MIFSWGLNLIVVEHDTFFKQVPKQSAELEADDKVFVAKGTEFYPIAVNMKPVAGHIRITLGDPKTRLPVKLGTKGYNTWWVWDDHVYIPGVDDKEHEAKKPGLEVPATPVPENFQYPKVGQINWLTAPFNTKVSKYFTVGEVLQLDRRRVPREVAHETNILRLARELDLIREDWGNSIGVTSWYRPSKPVDINSQVGGVKGSKHTYGHGCDIYDIGGNTIALEKKLIKEWRGGVGLGAKNKGFVHLDARAGFPCFKQGSAVVTWPYGR